MANSTLIDASPPMPAQSPLMWLNRHDDGEYRDRERVTSHPRDSRGARMPTFDAHVPDNPSFADNDMTELLPPPSPMLLTYDGDVTTERRRALRQSLSGADAGKLEGADRSNLVMRRIPTATAPSCWPSRTSRTLRSLRDSEQEQRVRSDRGGHRLRRQLTDYART